MDIAHNQFAMSYQAYANIRGLNSIIESDITHHLKKYNLSFPSFRTLWILYFDSSITMSELTYIAQTNISNAFRQLTKLTDADLVSMKIKKASRTKEFSITEKGRTIVKDFLDEHMTASHLHFVNVIKSLPEEDLIKFNETLSFISAQLLGKSYTDWVMNSSNYILNE